MLTCPYCGSETSSEDNFCENCEQQVKCMKPECEALLRPHKSKCLKCGTPTLVASQVDPSMNRYSHTATTTNKSHTEHTEITASDAAIGDFIPLVLSRSQVQPRPQPRPAAIRMNPQSQPKLPFPTMVEDKDEAYADATDGDEILAVTDVPPTSQSKQDENQALALEFFEASGDELTPLAPDFKGDSRKDQLIRFLVVYIWSYPHIFGKPVPSREHLVAATRRAGLPDDNFRQYFGLAKTFYSSIDGTFKANPAGNVEAKRVFDEIKTKTEEGNPYWKTKTKSASKGPRFNKENQEAIAQWVTIQCNIGSIDVRPLNSTQQAMLSLWLITKEIKVADAVKPRLAFEYLSAKFKTIKGTYKAFESALRRTTNQSLFSHNTEGAYFLQDKAEKEVETWRNLGAPDSKEAVEEGATGEDEEEGEDE